MSFSKSFKDFKASNVRPKTEYKKPADPTEEELNALVNMSGLNPRDLAKAFGCLSQVASVFDGNRIFLSIWQRYMTDYALYIESMDGAIADGAVVATPTHYDNPIPATQAAQPEPTLHRTETVRNIKRPRQDA